MNNFESDLTYRMPKYRPFTSESELATYNLDFGKHFFDAAAKRSFRSRVGAILHGRSPADYNIFVTSEQYEDSRGNRARRLYTVRQLQIDGSVKDLSQFQQYSTSAAARKAIRAYLEQGAPFYSDSVEAA